MNLLMQASFIFRLSAGLMASYPKAVAAPLPGRPAAPPKAANGVLKHVPIRASLATSYGARAHLSLALPCWPAW